MVMPSQDPDSRYARGEISRDEWQRLRNGPATVPPPAPAPWNRGPLLLIAVILVAAVAVAAAVMWSLGGSPAYGWNPTYGGAKMMQASDLATLNASATMGTAYMGNNTLWFHGGTVNLVVYMSPPDHDMAFVVQGMANPTIHMGTGSRVTVTIVNMDSGDYHNWALTKTAPPYSSMPMMSGGTMMSMTMVSPMSSTGYPSGSLSFSAQSGSYWYLCQYASHASQGMYGSFVVG